MKTHVFHKGRRAARRGGARRLVPFAAAVSWLAAVASCPAASAAFSYQGRLLDEAGTTPLSGNKTVELSLYDRAEGGSPLWGRAFNVLLDANGLFNVEVSDAGGSALLGAPAGVSLETVFAENADTTLYIGLKVAGTSGEISPRQALLAVPYATFAANVAAADGDLAVGGRLTADSAGISGAVQAGNLAVSGSLGAATLSTGGDATVGGDLSVGGSITGFGIAPVGSIILWSGADNAIPSDWALCDGRTENGRKTPDLRGRFVVGFDPGDSDYAVGRTGGEARHKLTIDEMPSHNHSYSFKAADLNGSWDNDNFFFDASEHYSGNPTNSKDTNSTGGNQAHENRPPYYALCYIMRVR